MQVEKTCCQQCRQHKCRPGRTTSLPVLRFPRRGPGITTPGIRIAGKLQSSTPSSSGGSGAKLTSPSLLPVTCCQHLQKSVPGAETGVRGRVSPCARSHTGERQQVGPLGLHVHVSESPGQCWLHFVRNAPSDSTQPGEKAHTGSLQHTVLYTLPVTRQCPSTNLSLSL